MEKAVRALDTTRIASGRPGLVWAPGLLQIPKGEEKPMSRSKDDMEDVGGLRSISYVMNKLDCGRTKIYSLVEAGRLEMVKLDRRARITDRSLQKLLRELVAQAKAEEEEDE
jgi:hypothetical protein